MKKLALLVLGLLLIKFQNAQSITWASNIAPIFYNNCTKCHHDNGIAPFRCSITMMLTSSATTLAMM
jgi:hypothetical protein